MVLLGLQLAPLLDAPALLLGGLPGGFLAPGQLRLAILRCLPGVGRLPLLGGLLCLRDLAHGFRGHGLRGLLGFRLSPLLGRLGVGGALLLLRLLGLLGPACGLGLGSLLGHLALCKAPRLVGLPGVLGALGLLLGLPRILRGLGLRDPFGLLSPAQLIGLAGFLCAPRLLGALGILGDPGLRDLLGLELALGKRRLPRLLRLARFLRCLGLRCLTRLVALRGLLRLLHLGPALCLRPARLGQPPLLRHLRCGLRLRGGPGGLRRLLALLLGLLGRRRRRRLRVRLALGRRGGGLGEPPHDVLEPLLGARHQVLGRAARRGPARDRRCLGGLVGAGVPVPPPGAALPCESLRISVWYSRLERSSQRTNGASGSSVDDALPAGGWP